MTDRRINPLGIQPSTTDDDVLTTVAGVAAWAAPAVPVVHEPLVTVVDGNPGLIFDNDGKIVYVEGP